MSLVVKVVFAVVRYAAPTVFQKEVVLKHVPKPLLFIYSTRAFQNMLAIAIYARVSTDQQDATRQVEDCQRIAERRDATISLYVDRGVSGAEFDRPEFQQLIHDVEQGGIDTVLATEASRIGRSFLQTAEFIHLCYEHGVKFEVLDGSFPTVDPDDEDEIAKKYAELMAWAADLERYFLRKRVQSGVDRAQRAGKWTGRPPYGFTTRGVSRRRTRRLPPNAGCTRTLRDRFRHNADFCRPS